MASPKDKDENGKCRVCKDRLKAEFARKNNPTKWLCQHMTNNNCPTKGNYELRPVHN